MREQLKEIKEYSNKFFDGYGKHFLKTLKIYSIIIVSIAILLMVAMVFLNSK